MRILILGGTALARQMAEQLVSLGEHQVTTSLAGRTKNAIYPPGEIRIGGFGGVSGLANYLVEHKIDALINAVHPFAAQMSANAEKASAATGIKMLRLTRASWDERPESANWIWVPDHQSAAEQAAKTPGNVLLTVGAQHSNEYFVALAERKVICRIATTLAEDPPKSWKVLQLRGPFTLEKETEIFSQHQISVLVSKDSGGEQTEAKLDLAAERGVKVIMISRPHTSKNAVTKVSQALDWVASQPTNLG